MQEGRAGTFPRTLWRVLLGVCVLAIGLLAAGSAALAAPASSLVIQETGRNATGPTRRSAGGPSEERHRLAGGQ